MSKTNENTVVADPYMEEICDKIRRGEPVGLLESLAAIEYQRQRKLQKPPTFWKRVVRFFLPNVSSQPSLPAGGATEIKTECSAGGD